MLRIPKIVGVLFLCAGLLASAGCGVTITTIGRDKSGESRLSSEPSPDRSGAGEQSGEFSAGSGQSSGDASEETVPGEGVPLTDTGEYRYRIPERYYSEGIKNIVRRARQIYETRWMPLSGLSGFNGDYFFPKGTEVRGIPYGQPVFSGRFVGFEATIDEFLTQSKQKESLFYTGYSEYGEKSTYYSLDCTTLVSYAWNTDVRMYTNVLVQYGDYVGKDIKKMEVGDALIRTGDGAHAVLITGIIEDKNGKIIWVEVIEQTPPLTKLSRYGEDEFYTVDEFIAFYLEDGFYIYRNTDYRDNIPYTPTPAAPLDGEMQNPKSPPAPFRSLKAKGIDNGMEIEAVFACDETIESVYYAVVPYFYGFEKYKTRPDASLRLRADHKTESETYDYIPPSTLVTVSEIYIDGNGERWGALRYNGNFGWAWLEGSEFLLGSLAPYKTVTVAKENVVSRTLEGRSYLGVSAKFVVENPSFDSAAYAGKTWKVMVFARSKSGNTYEIGAVLARVPD